MILFYDILRTVYFYVRVVGITILSNFLVGKCIILGQQSFRQNQITDHNDTDTGFKHHCTINQTLKCKNYAEATIEPENLLYTIMQKPIVIFVHQLDLILKFQSDLNYPTYRVSQKKCSFRRRQDLCQRNIFLGTPGTCQSY